LVDQKTYVYSCDWFMKKKVSREVGQREIVEKFNQGMSKKMLISFVSGTTGAKIIESQKMVETAIYEDYMRRK